MYDFSHSQVQDSNLDFSDSLARPRPSSCWAEVAYHKAICIRKVLLGLSGLKGFHFHRALNQYHIKAEVMLVKWTLVLDAPLILPPHSSTKPIVRDRHLDYGNFPIIRTPFLVGNGGTCFIFL